MITSTVRTVLAEVRASVSRTQATVETLASRLWGNATELVATARTISPRSLSAQAYDVPMAIRERAEGMFRELASLTTAFGEIMTRRAQPASQQEVQELRDRVVKLEGRIDGLVRGRVGPDPLDRPDDWICSNPLAAPASTTSEGE